MYVIIIIKLFLYLLRMKAQATEHVQCVPSVAGNGAVCGIQTGGAAD